jgi:hypothetical protein
MSVQNKIKTTQCHVEVKLDPGVRPTDDTSEMLIRKFLKACTRENLSKYIYEHSHLCIRYTQPSVERRMKRLKAEKVIRESEAKNKQQLDFLENNKRRTTKK